MPKTYKQLSANERDILAVLKSTGKSLRGAPGKTFRGTLFAFFITTWNILLENPGIAGRVVQEIHMKTGT